MSQPSSVRRPVRRGLTAHQDVPVLQHLLGGVFLEVDQLKQLDLITLRGEDQLVLLAVETHLERDLIKDLVQSPFILATISAPRVWSLSSSIIWRNSASISAKVSHQFSVRVGSSTTDCGREIPFLHHSINSLVSSYPGGLPMLFQSIVRHGPPGPDSSRNSPCGSSSSGRPESIPRGALTARGPF